MQNMHNGVTDALAKKARLRLLEMHYVSRVGHIGGNLSALDSMLLVFHEFLGPDDHFILSKGHSAGALYIALWSIGLISDEELASFHRDDTRLAGHPVPNRLPRVDFATGSLGHGLSLAAGTALALRFKDSNATVFCLTSDGEWQEGSTWEALIFATHQRLSNLVVMIDKNGLQGFGKTDEIASMSSLAQKLAGFDIDIDSVSGHDFDALRKTLMAPRERPRIIVMETIKGKGVSFMENRMEWHYRPLTDDLYQQALHDINAP